MYALVENDQVVEWPIDNLRLRYPNISFPADLSSATLPDGIVPVIMLVPPSYNPATHRLVQDTIPNFANNRWELGYSIVEFSAAEINERREATAQSIRLDRDQRLAQSDWTQVADAPVNKSAWAAYRQALRDVPQQPGFPFDVVWPTQPE